MFPIMVVIEEGAVLVGGQLRPFPQQFGFLAIPTTGCSERQTAWALA